MDIDLILLSQPSNIKMMHINLNNTYCFFIVKAVINLSINLLSMSHKITLELREIY